MATGPGVGADRPGHDQHGRGERAPPGVRRPADLDRHPDMMSGETMRWCPSSASSTRLAGGAPGDGALLRRDRCGLRLQAGDGTGRRGVGVRRSAGCLRGLRAGGRAARLRCRAAPRRRPGRDQADVGGPRGARAGRGRRAAGPPRGADRGRRPARGGAGHQQHPHRAVGLYESHGYRRVPDYNGNPDADVWFARSLRWGERRPRGTGARVPPARPSRCRRAPAGGPGEARRWPGRPPAAAVVGAGPRGPSAPRPPVVGPARPATRRAGAPG